MKKITLCADDYGQSPSIGRAIRRLIERGRLDLTTAMTASPHWEEEGARLSQVSCKLGLHLTLTEQPGFPDYRELLKKSYLRRIDHDWVAGHFRKQWDAFLEVWKKPPHFVDGHQYVHQLPIVRRALVEVYLEHCPDRDVPIRLSLPPREASKTMFDRARQIPAVATQLFLKRQRIPVIRNVLTSWQNNPNFEEWYNDVYSTIKSPCLIACHPGEWGTKAEEFRFLDGPGFERLISEDSSLHS